MPHHIIAQTTLKKNNTPPYIYYIDTHIYTNTHNPPYKLLGFPNTYVNVSTKIQIYTQSHLMQAETDQ